MNPFNRRLFLQNGLVGFTALPFLLRSSFARNVSNPHPPEFFLFYQIAGAWDICLAFDAKDRDKRSDSGEKLFDQPYEMNECIQIAEHILPPQAKSLKSVAKKMTVINGINMQIDNGHIVDAVMSGVQNPRGVNAPFVQAILANQHPYAKHCPVPHLFTSYGNTFFPGPFASSTAQVKASDFEQALRSQSQSFRATHSPLSPDLLLKHMHRDFQSTLSPGSQKVFSQFSFAQDQLQIMVRRWLDSTQGIDIPQGNQLDQAPDLGTLFGYLFASGICGMVTVHSQYMFDTHANHYADHPLTKALDDVTSMYKSLEAIELLPGISVADRTTVILASEYCRSPRLNTSLGKEHNFDTNSLVWFGHLGNGKSYGASAENPNSHFALPTDYGTGRPQEQGRVMTIADVWAGMGSLWNCDIKRELPSGTIPISFLRG